MRVNSNLSKTAADDDIDVIKNQTSSSSSNSTPQDSTLAFSITPEVESVAFKSSRALVFGLNLKAKEFIPEGTSERARIDLACVIDRSGSMSGEKMKLTKETMLFVIEQMSAKDRLSIIAYDDVVEEVMTLTAMDAAGKKRAVQATESIDDRGSTNLCGGLLKGIKVLQEKKKVESGSKKDVCSVLLLTDGMANVGPSTSELIIAEMRKNSPSKELANLECVVNTFAIGSDHDSKLLKSIAESGNGVYYYIKSTEEISSSFADCIGGLMSVVAQNISIEVKSMNGCKIRNLMFKYTQKEVEKGAKYEIKVADIQSEESKDLLFLVDVPASETVSESQQLLEFKIKYFDVISACFQENIVYATLKRPEAEPANQAVNVELDRQRNRVMATEAIRNATEFGDANKLAEGRVVLEKAMEQIKQSASANDAMSAQIVNDLQMAWGGMENRTSYAQQGRHIQSNMVVQHEQQRSASASTGMYENKSKKAMKMAVRKDI